MLARHTREPICRHAFMALVIGYDGKYYLCNSDWRKQVPMGSVFERAVLDTFDDRSAHMTCSTSLCTGCSIDPVNKLAMELRDAGPNNESDGVANINAAILAEWSNGTLEFLTDLGRTPTPTAKRVRRIPLHAE